MLFKVVVIIFTLIVISEIKGLFKKQNVKDFIGQYNDLVKRIGVTRTNRTYIFTALGINAYLIVFYIVVGGMNELLMWVSALQIILALKNTYSMLSMTVNMEKGDFDKVKLSTIYYRVFNTFVDISYIGLIVYYIIK